MINTIIDHEAPKGYYRIVHPERQLETVKATIIGWYRQNGCNVGLELQFPNEEKTRKLKFSEIRRLQSRAIEDFLEKV